MTRRLAAALAALLLGGCTAGPAAEGGPASADARARLAAQELDEAAAVGGSPYGDYLAGLFANRRRDLSSAADYMARALADDPDNPALLESTFMLMASEGRMARARELAGRLLELDPDHATARLLRVVEAAKRGETEAAETAVAELPRDGLSSLMGPLAGAWMAIARGDLAEAERRLQPLAGVDGLGALRHVHTALLRDVAASREAAGESYRAALESTGRLSLRLVWLIGNYYERRGEAERAVALYRRYLAEHPDSSLMGLVLERAGGGRRPEPMVADAREGLAEALFNMAGLLSQEGAGDMALVYTRLALYLRPDFTVARMLLGEILQDQGRTRESIAVYEAVDPASPFDYIARLRVAEGLDEIGRSEEAVARLRALAGEHPRRYEPLFRVGNLLRRQERFAEAAAAYDAALARIDEPQRRHWTLFYFRGIAHERTDRWAEAERDLKAALELEPEQPYVMNYLAYSWVEQQAHLDEAQAMLRKAVDMRPDDGYIVDSLGWVHYRLGHYDKAVQYLERAVELRPQDPVINDHLGDAYWRVGRRQEARFQWRRALSLEPEDDTVAGIEAKLERGLAPEKNNI